MLRVNLKCYVDRWSGGFAVGEAWRKGEVDEVHREAEMGLKVVNGVLVSVRSDSEVVCG